VRTKIVIFLLCTVALAAFLVIGSTVAGNKPAAVPSSAGAATGDPTAAPDTSASAAVTSQQLTGCVKQPSRCGYPDATNTGWRRTGVTLTTDGVNLTSEGEMILDKPNTVIDGKDIQGCVSIKADNVTIKRSRVRCGSYFVIRLYDGFKNAVMEDIEVDGLNSRDGNAALGFDSITVRRADIHHVTDGPHPGANSIIEDSYVHDLFGCDICHNDAIQTAGAINGVLRHNTFINGASGRNSAIRIATEQGPVRGFLVENNLLAGGNYAIQVRSQGFGFPSGVVVTGNRIVPDWRYGPFDVVGGTIVAKGNFRDDNLAAVTP
jgi:hypothetical protein